MEFTHKPVLLAECIEALHIRPEGIYVDGTLGRVFFGGKQLGELDPSNKKDRKSTRLNSSHRT